jgi:sigma-B regulation protein RsbU (phosphoserine phosphatase)
MADLRILLVDDEDLILHVLKEFFRHRRDLCDTAGNGMEALRLVEDRIYDLILTDISMPGMDGLELVRRVKTLQPHAVCILMSGLGTRRDIISALKIGVFDFVDKPIPDLASLTMVVDRAAESSRLVRERDALLENLRQQNAKLEYSLLRLHEAFGQLRRQEEALEADLLRAQCVQRKFLPSAFPKLNGLDLFGYYAPCEQLSGDFFGAISLNNGKIAVYLVDVAGHGVSAAMVTVIFRELMRARLRERDGLELFQDPSQVLSYLNEALRAESFDPPIFVSMVYAVLDPATGQTSLASAGHPAPIVATEKAAIVSSVVSGRVLGAQAPSIYQTVELQLELGDSLLIYSDGLSEARNANGQEFTVQRLHQIVAEQRNRRASLVGEAIETQLVKHVDGHAPTDDISFLVASRLLSSIPAIENVPFVGEMLADSVKILMPDKMRHASTDTRGRAQAGWHDKTCVIKLAGVATWPLAPAVREMVIQGKSRSADPLHIDLAECEAMDSTILGLLLQNATELVLHQPSSRVVAQLHEMGVLALFNISHDICVTPETAMAISSTSSQQACSELILSAHEALMEASVSNRQRFKDVVNTLKTGSAHSQKKDDAPPK